MNSFNANEKINNNKIEVKLFVGENENLASWVSPISYAKEGDAGMDLRAKIEEAITLGPLERKIIPTGIKISLPLGTQAEVRPRSGMASKHGISVLNTPGTVDEAYVGEIGVIAVNLSNVDYTIQPNERIAQLVFMPYLQAEIIPVRNLPITKRGEVGFGSTGK